ncbi:MAG: TMEM43 family protein [Oligosphaeraceae bacterium]
MSEGNSGYTVTETESWGSRLGGSIKGVITGVILFLVSFVVLFKNEGCAVRQARALEEGKSSCVSVSSDRVDMANEGKLIHTSGKAETQDVLSDSNVGLSEVAFRLERKVEIYQWVEDSQTREEKKLGGSKEKVTTYTYKKEWVSKPVDSSAFKDPQAPTRNANVGTLPLDDMTQYCSNAKLGAFTLNEALIRKVGGAQDYVFAQGFKLPETLPAGSRIEGKYVVIPFQQPVATQVATAVQPVAGQQPAVAPQPAVQQPVAGQPAVQQQPVAGQPAVVQQPAAPAQAGVPQIGDVRISYRMVRPHDFSVVGVQQGDTIVAHVASNGESNLLTADSIKSAAEMYRSAEEANSIKLWLFRLLGFVLMYSGLRAVFRPLEVLGDVVPFIGSIIGAGAGIVSFLIAAPLSLVTIAVAWIAYRPVVGIILLVAAGAIGYLVYAKAKAKKAAVATAA